VLGQLGHRVQHALRAFTPDDDKALRAAARTFPKTEFYDIEETLTTLGTGEALITTLSRKGVPSPPFATRLIPPAASMAPLPDADFAARLTTPQVRKYAQSLDRQSAHEVLAQRVTDAAAAEPAEESTGRRKSTRRRKEPPSALEKVLNSRAAGRIGTQATRTVLNALLRRVLG